MCQLYSTLIGGAGGIKIKKIKLNLQKNSLLIHGGSLVNIYFLYFNKCVNFNIIKILLR